MLKLLNHIFNYNRTKKMKKLIFICATSLFIYITLTISMPFFTSVFVNLLPLVIVKTGLGLLFLITFILMVAKLLKSNNINV